ncbi:hypothetical protein CEUSTIGMA_g10091.t1 [Chlamydomonas eustigma]|uniref:Isopentenyl phosphate kinase n=1 Tax=Chlamydomonas eustigma TaxID=1157962 RepID=A0A250XHV5_9CHLO|nr:hypothetical protein CEUSTIGMA_g10091.t1 [Chlamydomonas eustigma]|eukprot:GAX82665.1 hypothetical protein CEUSTIGMA_g10091.t1 [Chlamydomonas eustigma]
MIGLLDKPACTEKTKGPRSSNNLRRTMQNAQDSDASANVLNASIRKIIKLGGAAITHKGTFETPDLHTIKTVAQHISETYQALRSADPSGLPGLVIVHGAGSFGHHQASQYSVKSGWGLDTDQVKSRAGFCLTRASVQKLNGIVVDALISEGLPAVGISPFASGWRTRNSTVKHDGCSAVLSCLSAGLLPVLHGDCVLDDQLGCTILSGDTVLRRLAENAAGGEEAVSAVFLTNVAGVYDRPPSETGATLVKRIEVEKGGSWSVPGLKLSSSSCPDTTGGMEKKVEEAASVAGLGIEVVIAHAGTESGRRACLLNATQIREIDEGSGHHSSMQQTWQGTVVGMKTTQLT